MSRSRAGGRLSSQCRQEEEHQSEDEAEGPRAQDAGDDDESSAGSDVSEREKLRRRPNRRKSVYVGVQHMKDGSWEAKITIEGKVGACAAPGSWTCTCTIGAL